MAYASLIERNHFVLRRVQVPVLASGARPMRVLHISDMHLMPEQHRKQRWVRELDELDPDLVITTGDNIAAKGAVGPALSALGPLLDRPGAFVFGSNDYYAPRPRNPFRYFLPRAPLAEPAEQLPANELADGLVAAGWLDLNNARGTLGASGRTVALAGVDDPHIRRDRYARVAGPADRSAAVRIGLTHAPEPRVLDRFAADGYDLVLAGHTHGGQLRVPYLGALVTNCGLDRARCRGLSRWGVAWLHVSAGLGTSPYAPVRFACPPEASLLELVARPERRLRTVA